VGDPPTKRNPGSKKLAPPLHANGTAEINNQNASASIKNQRVANSVRSKSFNWGLLLKGEKKVAPERV
jgi:hypothetical protein